MASKKTTSVTHGLGHSTTGNLAMNGSKAGKINRSAHPPAANRSGKPPRPHGAVATPLGTKFQRGGFPKK